jgi:hypothetical protein
MLSQCWMHGHWEGGLLGLFKRAPGSGDRCPCSYDPKMSSIAHAALTALSMAFAMGWEIAPVTAQEPPPPPIPDYDFAGRSDEHRPTSSESASTYADLTLAIACRALREAKLAYPADALHIACRDER